MKGLKFEFKEDGCAVSLKELESSSVVFVHYGPNFDLEALKAIDNIFKKNKIKKPLSFRVYIEGKTSNHAVAKRIVDTFKKASKI